METIVRTLNGYTVSLCQFLALIVILTGVIKALIIYAKNVLSQSQAATFQKSRLAMGYSFSLGLSFLIGASILKTTIAPTWNDIGHLAATIALRTVLNYFLLQAIKGDLQNSLLLDNNSTSFGRNVVSNEDKLVHEAVNYSTIQK